MATSAAELQEPDVDSVEHVRTARLRKDPLRTKLAVDAKRDFAFQTQRELDLDPLLERERARVDGDHGRGAKLELRGDLRRAEDQSEIATRDAGSPKHRRRRRARCTRVVEPEEEGGAPRASGD